MLYVVMPPLMRGRSEEVFMPQLSKEFTRTGAVLINPPQLRNTIKVGDFYDEETLVKKCLDSYMALIKKLKKGDRIFFLDFWLPGIDVLKYFSERLELGIKIGALVVGGTPVRGDSSQSWGDWIRNIEPSWVSSLDFMLFNSYHCQKSFAKRYQLPKNATCLLPFYQKGILKYKKKWKDRKDWVVFPHRWVIGKHPEIFLKYMGLFKDNAVVLTPRELPEKVYCKVFVNKTREEYLERLSRAKVIFSASDMETGYGTALQEAITLGVTPLVTDKQVDYRSLYNRRLRYKTMNEARGKVKLFLREEQVEYLPNLKPLEKSDREIVKMVNKYLR